jgi:predicted helicase
MGVKDKTLRKIASLDGVIKFLSEELDWPVDPEDVERSSFNYTSEELRVNPEIAKRINSIRQLRPKVQGQPWGIFLLDLSGAGFNKRTIREVLRTLTSKRRGSRQPGAWNSQSLLFIVSSGEGEKFEIHFLAFKDDNAVSSQIYSVDWRPNHMTAQYSKRLTEEILPKLKWPKDPSRTIDWHDSWQAAFALRPGQVMTDASALVNRMAQVAVSLRQSIKLGFESEGGDGPLHKLMSEIKSELVGDVNQNSFADMCAQTITYGLLAAKVQDPDGFGRSPVLDYLPLNNPFLESLFAEVQDAIVGLPHEEDSLEALYADLRETNVAAILDQFGNSAHGGDPVIHFYENFLAKYDNKIRLDVGAVYTPKPVVDSMVRLLDDVLKAHFKLPLGIADNSSWSTVCEALKIEVPAGVDPSSPFVSIIDPATGTGTYLISLLERASLNLSASGKSTEDVSEYLRDEFTAKLKAFELLLGPYAIANFKLGLALGTSEKPSSFKVVHLTNSLTLNHLQSDLWDTGSDSPISIEGQAANDLKLNKSFTVIIGNPPYKREAKKNKDEARANLGGIIRNGYQAIFGSRAPLADFEEGLARQDKNKKSNLLNLYVYFWRWAMWQLGQKGLGNSGLQATPRPGVIAFITGSSFIKDISFGGMRSNFRDFFDEIFIVDLGGDSYAGMEDPNVFDIQSPVAITIAITKGKKDTTKSANVKYIKIEGTRAEKLERLTQLELAHFESVDGEGTQKFTSERESRLTGQPYLAEFFKLSSTGCLPGRSWVTSPSSDVLGVRWEALLRSPLDEKDSYFRVGDNRNSKSKPFGFRTNKPVPSIVELTSGSEFDDCIRYSYRPFDHQYLIRDPRVLGQPSIFIMHQSETQIYFGSGGSVSGGPSVLAFPYVPDKHAFNGRGGKDFYPRLNPKDGSSNLSSSGLDYAKKFSLIDPESDLIGYIYGIHGTGAYFEIFREDLGLGLDRAKVPLTFNRATYEGLSRIGLQLMNTHLGREEFKVDGKLETFRATPANTKSVPTAIKYQSNEQAIYFDDTPFCNIPNEIWDFKSNGIHVAKSWLENRKAEPKGKRSSPLDQLNEQHWIYNEEFVKMIADVSAVIEAKKLVMPLLQQIVEELEAQPGK